MTLPGRHALGAATHGTRPAAILQFAAGAALWGALMALSAAVSLIWLDWRTDEQIRAVSTIFGLGGVVGYLLARIGFRLAIATQRIEARFAAHLFTLAAGTIGATATLYAMHHRVYFAQWHAPFPSVDWTLQLIFTILGAFYQFAALGLRLYLPVGVPALIVFALCLTARAR